MHKKASLLFVDVTESLLAQNSNDSNVFPSCPFIHSLKESCKVVAFSTNNQVETIFVSFAQTQRQTRVVVLFAMTCYDRGAFKVIINGANQPGDVCYLVPGSDKIIVHY